MKGKKEPGGMDEMQNLQLMKLEEHGFWIAFWALCAAVVGQALMGAGRGAGRAVHRWRLHYGFMSEKRTVVGEPSAFEENKRGV